MGLIHNQKRLLALPLKSHYNCSPVGDLAFVFVPHSHHNRLAVVGAMALNQALGVHCTVVMQAIGIHHRNRNRSCLEVVRLIFAAHQVLGKAHEKGLGIGNCRLGIQVLQIVENYRYTAFPGLEASKSRLCIVYLGVRIVDCRSNTDRSGIASVVGDHIHLLLPHH
jgi:hypothetical protein